MGNPHKLNNNDVATLDIFFELALKKKHDIFGIKYQFDNWINNNLNIPILFLDFNDVLQQKNTINKFIGKELNYD